MADLPAPETGLASAGDTLAPDGLCWAFLMDGHGNAAPLTAGQLAGMDWPRPAGLHRDATGRGARAWLEDEANLAPDIVAALLAAATRPRFDPAATAR